MLTTSPTAKKKNFAASTGCRSGYEISTALRTIPVVEIEDRRRNSRRDPTEHERPGSCSLKKKHESDRPDE